MEESPVAYVTAPNSPIDLEEFEFGTCLNPTVDDSVKGYFDKPDPGHIKFRNRGDSLPAMAFADELFVNGLVMPLKLPPRLQSEGVESNSFVQRSPTSSPRSNFRLPFGRKGSWTNDFDPFTVALEKVREEDRGRKSHHRRSRSYSPFRGPITFSNESYDTNSNKDRPVVEVVKVHALNHSGPLDFKGAAYARWVRDQTCEGISPKSPENSLFRKRVRPVKDLQDSQDKPEIENHDETKPWNLKRIILRYASFRKGDGGTKKPKTKTGYFERVGFKVKRNRKEKKKKIGSDDGDNMAVVKYKGSSSSFTMCLGGGVLSPAMSK